MKGKKVISLALSALTLVALCGCQTTTKETLYFGKEADYTDTVKGTPLPVYTKYFDCIGGKNVMPIGTYSGPSTGEVVNAYQIESMISEKYFDLFKACGINMFNSSLDAAAAGGNVVKMLELCERYGMGMFVKDSVRFSDATATTATADEIFAFMQNYMQYESFCGLTARDEPSMTEIDAWAKFVESFKQTPVAQYYDLYFNALPQYAGASMMGAESFEEYAKYYIEKLQLDYFSYDYYPFGAGGYVKPEYFESLSEVKAVTDEAQVPWWTFIQAGCSFESKVSENWPDEGRFHWNVNTSLAYGAKGVQYFTLSQPSFFLDWEDPEGATREGLFGYFNNINEWYYYAQKANKQILAIDHILMNANNVGVIFHGESPVTKSTGSEVIAENKFRQLTSVSGSDALIGCFDYCGGTALYVVNNSYENNDARINLFFDGSYGYDVIQRGQSAFVAGNALSLRLDKGEGALVVLR